MGRSVFREVPGRWTRSALASGCAVLAACPAADSFGLARGYDTDTNNAAMQVVSGSHRRGPFAHHTNDNPYLVLDQEADISNCQPEDIVTIDLKAGEISPHDSGLLHGSDPNQSQRMRCGMTIRFAPTRVPADLSEWPTFEAYMARGVDRLHLNPHGPVPAGEDCPVRKFQHSSEFE